jgi:predicted amidophosphoribosyltransferase
MAVNAKTVSPVVLCCSCGKKVPIRLHSTNRCQRCGDALSAVNGAFDADVVEILPAPDQGQPGSFLWYARQDRSRRLKKLKNPTDKQVAAIVAWSKARHQIVYRPQPQRITGVPRDPATQRVQ